MTKEGTFRLFTSSSTLTNKYQLAKIRHSLIYLLDFMNQASAENRLKEREAL